MENSDIEARYQHTQGDLASYSTTYVEIYLPRSLLHNTPRTVQNSSTRTKYLHRKS